MRLKIYIILLCQILTVFFCHAVPESKVSLRVGLPHYPPVSFRGADGKPTGFCIELLEYFASANDWKLEYVPGTWNQCLDRMKNHEIDILCGMVNTPQRDIWFNFSAEPLYVTWGKIFVRTDFDYRTVLQLDNRRIGVVSGDFYADSFKSFILPFKIRCSYVPFNSYQDAFSGLKNGRVDAIVAESTEVVKYFHDPDVHNTGIIFGPRQARFGYSKKVPREIVSRIDKQLIDYRSNPDSAYYELYDKYFVVENESRIPDWFWFALYGALSAAAVFIVISLVLRFKVKRQMRQVVERENDLRITLDSIGDAVIVTDENGIVIRMNPVAEGLTGWFSRDATGRKIDEIFKVVNPVNGQPIENPVDRVLSSGNIEGLPDFSTLLGRHGTRRQVADSAAPIHEGTEKMRGVVLVFRDVTDEYESRKRLRDSEARLHKIFNCLPVMVIAYDEDGSLAYWNPECERILGWTEEEMVGLTRQEVFEKVYPEMDYRIIKTGTHEKRENRNIEWVAMTKDKVAVELLWSDMGSETNIPGWSAWSVGVEVSKMKDLERQMRQMQKLESLGSLAGGVAHDFNNILQIIRGYTEIIHDTAGDIKEINEPAQTILSSVERGSNLVRQMLYFSRQSGFAPELVNPAELVLNLAGMLKRVIGEDIIMDLDINGMVPVIKADSSQLEQVVINLCINARQAMPDGGSLKISVRKTDIPALEKTVVGDISPGRYVMVQVADSGCGIPQEIQARIFDPFFTTREIGDGAGLGLSTVYGVVKRHHGGIRLHSVPGQGAIFSILLPVDESLAAEPVVEAHSPTVGDIMDTHRIFQKVVLLAEDETIVRTLTENILSNAGYEVLSVSNGRDAVDLFRVNADRIDLLLFDIIMPGMSGFEAYHEILKMKPGMPVIFCTGYDETNIEMESMAGHPVNVLHKPFTKKALLSAVDKELSG